MCHWLNHALIFYRAPVWWKSSRSPSLCRHGRDINHKIIGVLVDLSRATCRVYGGKRNVNLMKSMSFQRGISKQSEPGSFFLVSALYFRIRPLHNTFTVICLREADLYLPMVVGILFNEIKKCRDRSERNHNRKFVFGLVIYLADVQWSKNLYGLYVYQDSCRQFAHIDNQSSAEKVWPDFHDFLLCWNKFHDFCIFGVYMFTSITD